jgi:hypothetical protein
MTNRAHQRSIAALIMCAGFALCGLGYQSWAESRSTRQTPLPVDETARLPGGQGTLFVWPGTVEPPTVKAEDVKMADSEPVIGVRVGKRSRAYRVSAFSGAQRHVVNDVIDGQPVTITYCDRKKCARVFTGKGRKPLRIDTGGYLGGLILKVSDHFYFQVDAQPLLDDDREPFPYESMEFVELPWSAWQNLHPDTDAYVGNSQ